FIPIRKPGKLPREKRSESYALEYGTDTLEMHADALSHGEKVVIVDDLLATGGTMKACHDLVKGLGAEILGVSVLIELEFLKGRAQLPGVEVQSVLRY
ncbi:MAG: Adenine phosphoribosyltransferase, partial [Planctomycetota bacterium]